MIETNKNIKFENEGVTYDIEFNIDVSEDETFDELHYYKFASNVGDCFTYKMQFTDIEMATDGSEVKNLEKRRKIGFEHAQNLVIQNIISDTICNYSPNGWEDNPAKRPLKKHSTCK